MQEIDLAKLLEQYRNGERGLPTYAELQAVVQQQMRREDSIQVGREGE